MRVMEERKMLRDTLEKQWKIDLQQYHEVLVPQWQAECAGLDTAWAAAKQLAGRSVKKPSYPPRPERPLKPKMPIEEKKEAYREVEDGPG